MMWRNGESYQIYKWWREIEGTGESGDNNTSRIILYLYIIPVGSISQ